MLGPRAATKALLSAIAAGLVISMFPGASVAAAGQSVSPKFASIPGPGAQLWATVSTANNDARYIAVTPSGSEVIVSGWTNSPPYVSISAYDTATGAVLWSKYDPGGDDSIAMSPDGSKVYETAGGLLGFSVYALDISTGGVVWLGQYSQTGHPFNQDAPSRVAVSPDGSLVYVSGDTAATSIANPVTTTAAFNSSSGSLVWVAVGQAVGGTVSLGVTSDGSKVIVGEMPFGAIAYNALSGTELWAAQYGTSTANAVATAMAISPDGRAVFLTGASVPILPHHDNWHFRTVAFSGSTGAVLWSRGYYNLGGSSQAMAVHVSADSSRVFVTGASSVGATTIAYATRGGAQLWTAYYVGLGSEAVGTSVDVSRDGQDVFVVGWSANSAASSELFGTAYSAVSGIALRTVTYSLPFGRPQSNPNLVVSPDGSTVFVCDEIDSTQEITLAYRV